MWWHGQRTVDLLSELLDRQVEDDRGEPVGKVDDLELVRRADGRLEVTRILLGPAALGRRVGGWPGRVIDWFAHRFGGTGQPAEIPVDQVTEIGAAVSVPARVARAIPSTSEQWLRDHVVGRIPGGDHDAGQ